LPRWLLVLVAVAFALILYCFLRTRVPRWLLIPLVIVVAPVSVLLAIVGVMYLFVAVSVVVLTPYPLHLYLLAGAATFLIAAVIGYLIRRWTTAKGECMQMQQLLGSPLSCWLLVFAYSEATGELEVRISGAM
jgi:hypothetical protein